MNLFKKVLDKRLGTWYYSQAVSETATILENDTENEQEAKQSIREKIERKTLNASEVLAHGGRIKRMD